MKITNRYNLPQPFVSAVTREYTYKDKQYSVTAILKGVCQTILERRHADEIEQDVADMNWLILGSAVHLILENAQEESEQLKENKIVIPLKNGYKLSGIFDLYDDKIKTVTDYKNTSVNKYLYNDWGEYRNQVLIYCWMLQQIGFEAKRGEIIAMFRDWSQNKAKADPTGYPQSPIYKIGWAFRNDDFNEIEIFIDNKFESIQVCELLPDELLPACTPEERWHEDDTYAVIKKGNKRAKRVLNTEQEAQDYIENNQLKGYVIEKRIGEDRKCENYCTVNKWCPFYQMKLKEEENASKENAVA